MNNLATKTVREIALEIPVSTRIFEEYKIDYCCGGRVPFVEACQNAGANPETVLDQINQVQNGNNSQVKSLNNVSLTKLINYISEKHHTLTREEIFRLSPLMSKVANRHGHNHVNLLELEPLFNELADDLMQHLLKEENVLFPYVEQLERTLNSSAALPMSCFGTVQNPVRMMMMEHDTAGDILKKMRQLTNDYQPPVGACPSFTALYERLQDFEKDLHQHIHLENNLLFPKAVDLEEKVLS